MVKTEGSRPRSLSVIFSGYVLLAILFAFFLSDRLAPGWYDITWTRWFLAGYVLLGSVCLAAVCAGAARRAARLDARIEGLEDAYYAAVAATMSPASRDAVEPPTRRGVTPREPTDQDVDQLLVELEQVGQAVSVLASGEPEPGSALRATAELRIAGGGGIERLRRARDSVAARAAGPAIASAALIGLFSALMPAADGMLLTDLRMNAFLILSGFAILVGIAGYAGASFRQRPR